MKLSTQKVLGIAVVTLLSSFALLAIPHPILRSYLQVAILILALGASLILCGWSCPRHQNLKLVTLLVVLSAVVFQLIIFLLLGLKLGFARNLYGLNFTNLLQITLPVILTIVGEELLRGQLVEHGRRSLFAVLMAGATIWLLNLCTALPAYQFSTPQAVFTFLAVVAGPSLLTNILLTYLTYAYDYRIGLAYRLIMSLPGYILPIVPDAGVYLPTIFEAALVIILALALVGAHRTLQLRQESVRSLRARPERPLPDQVIRLRRRLKWAGTSLAFLLVLGYVALMSGLFKYYLLAIGSGSMEPNIYRGDMILVEKTQDYPRMLAGDILVYRHGDVIMVHRITEVIESDGRYTFQTKGDHNATGDSWQVDQSDIIGLVRGRISMFGYPTLWLNELFKGESS